MIGTTLNDRYKLLERIGAGGMASVFRAQDLLLGREIAVKMLHDGLAGDELFVRQFQREAHSAANLSHPNIVTVHDIGQYQHRSFIVMEYIEGQTLKALIRHYAQKGQVMPLNLAFDLVIQVCQGIGYAHRSGLVHCDVKPQNMLVTADRYVKVADFGIARAMTQSSMQHSDMVWGTPQYFSPEQAAGEAATPASDVYSLGIILFEMLTGRLPFEGESATAIALKHLQEPPPQLSQFNAQLPEQLERVVRKVLAKEPAGRYRTAGQLSRILIALRDRLSEMTALQTSRPTMLPMPVGKPRREVTGGMLDEEEQTTAVLMPKLSLHPSSSPEEPEEVEELKALATAVAEPDPRTDWVAISLGVTALVALLGLIPLWYFVYLAWQ